MAQFQDAVGVPVSPYFDNLVEMDPPCAASPSAIPLVEGVVGHGMRARQLAETILAKGWKFPGVHGGQQCSNPVPLQLRPYVT